MTAVRPVPDGRLRPQGTRLDAALFRSAQRLIEATNERAVVACIIVAFAALWLAFHSISLWPVDLRDDASEAALWAQHFAFGYKHPPLTAWLFMAWFAVFPRADWAMHLEGVVLAAASLAIAWVLLRDHLDRERSLIGLAALIMVPLYTIKAAELNANTVMMPFWAAALLFYLRARRNLGTLNAVLAGVFAALAFLGKYWAVYLIAGMIAASFAGGDLRRFWRSRAPYLMAIAALVVVAPHASWFLAHSGGSDYAFIRDSVMNHEPFKAALGGSIYYIVGVVGYAVGPLVLLALLRPSPAAIADVVRPADSERRIVLILFVVPMVLPALVNLIQPYRLTPDWTFPNWALLPVVLYGGRKLAAESLAAASALALAFAASVACLIAAPFIADVHLERGLDPNRPTSQEVAASFASLGERPQLYLGSETIVGNLPFYLPGSQPLLGNPQSPANRAAIASQGLLIACLDNDARCRASMTALAGPNAAPAAGTIRRSFLGFSGLPVKYESFVVPAQRDQ